MRRVMKKLLKFLKRVLAIAVMLPLSLLLFPLLVLIAAFFFLFDIPIPSTREEKAKEAQLNRAEENADALNDSLCSLEQNNYMDAEYLLCPLDNRKNQNSILLS